MDFLRKAAAMTTMTGAFLTAAVIGTDAEAHADDSEYGDGNSGSSGLIAISPSFGDSLLEIDRTLNLNDGPGSAGSDNENGD